MQQIYEHDLKLINAVQHGDRNSFDILVTKYQHKILKLVRRYVKDSDESFDIVQESFIKAYNTICSFRQESSFFTWLYRIAINTAKSYLADHNRCFSNFSFDVLEKEYLFSIMQDHFKDQSSDQEDLILCSELENMFCSITKNLPEELKTTIKLREVNELTYEEIAALMVCPVGTVRSRLFRARAAIEKQMADQKSLH